MEYQLKIEFEDKDLKNIYSAAQKVVLIKESPGNDSVAWVTIDPFEYNTVSWNENYNVYCSKTQIQNGATIDKLSEKNAEERSVYDFGSGIFENNKGEKTSKGSYQVNNTTTDNLTFGLAQDVVANGSKTIGAPINASTVLAGQNGIFTPFEKVKILLQSNVMDGLVLSTISSNIYTAEFGGEIDSLSVRYDGSTGHFIEI
ncbi:hypothetical protein [Chengkuizengella sediminis]|uniref:hypothetical protein n=1 Tax=Chengkuizengella sediminis TaxID=1885917 RepID=UPI00138A277E|nr:hypothetical protein [Chengkuizengella sediminis]NDI35738.1 hypothetical protein [Chengkuizengella sediminis]